MWFFPVLPSYKFLNLDTEQRAVSLWLHDSGRAYVCVCVCVPTSCMRCHKGCMEKCVCVSLCRQIVNNKPSHTEITESLQSAPLFLSRHLTSSHLPLVFPPRHLYTPLSDRQDRSAAALLNNARSLTPVLHLSAFWHAEKRP